jgi:alpha-mannosidase
MNPRRYKRTERHFTVWALSCFLLALSGVAQNTTTPSSAVRYKATLDRLQSLTILSLPEWHFHADIAHPEDSRLDDSGWEVMKTGESWTNGSRVFRRWLEIPEKVNDYAVQGSRVKLDLNIRSNDSISITVFVNGSVVYRGDEDMQQPIAITDNAQPGQRFLVAVRVDGPEVKTLLYRAQLTIEPPASRPDPAMLRTEIVAAFPLISAYEEGKAEREETLGEAVKAIDFTVLGKGDQAGFDVSLRQAQEKLDTLRPWMKQFSVRAIGNSHIDMAWLWPWTETVEVVRNTFRSVLDLMREYPDFKFTMSSARTYQWMEEKYPDLFREIQQRVKEGRWEVIGGMWVEPDLNMPDGESLVRQILVGKRYFQEKFGIDVKIGWNPDSFGYNWQLPQLYKKSGIDYFVTSKLLWATDYTRFPYRLFWWQAPDGSRLLSYFPHEYDNNFDPERMMTDLAFYTPLIYGPKLVDHPEMMYLYGVGDHGGGPTRTMLDTADRLRFADTVFPSIEFSTAKDFFHDIQGELPNLKVPTWNGELYFQYHRGVFTTQSETKRRIRESEETLLTAEKVSSLASLYGRPYPQEEFEHQWKSLLFDHFHDIMPGSGIAVNYLDAKRNLEEVGRAGREIIRGSMTEILAHINTEGDGLPVVIFNSLSWPRVDAVEVEAQLPTTARAIEVVDSGGKAVMSQLLSSDAATHRAHLLVVATVPALGYKTYFVRAAAKEASRSSSLEATADSLENEFIRLKIDPQSGCMTSLFDKRSQTEALAPAETDSGGPKNSICGNLLQAFVDKPKQWDAWNIDADFEQHHWDLDKADEINLIESGPVRAVIRIKNHFQSSTFVRDITMYAGVPRVDVKMQADWHEKHILLKVAFPLSAHGDKATFEIPYGSIERPTTRNTPAGQAQFEVPAQRWADICDSKHGFGLLNDSKYGYDAKGNVLRLSLLRSPEWPDPHADEGHHEFTYSLYPHGGTWREAQTVRRGYELNYKLMARQTGKHDGQLAAEHSFLQVQPDNVIVTAVKKAEDDSSLIVRFYEWEGQEADVTLTLPQGVETATETDLMERPSEKVSVRNDVIRVHVMPYEIKTVKVGFAATQAELR